MANLPKTIGTYLKNPDPIYLRCNASGVPTPKYKWTHRSLKFTVADLPVLVIQNPQSDRFGNYMCKASNGVGDVIHTVTVYQIST